MACCWESDASSKLSETLAVLNCLMTGRTGSGRSAK